MFALDPVNVISPLADDRPFEKSAKWKSPLRRIARPERSGAAKPPRTAASKVRTPDDAKSGLSVCSNAKLRSPRTLRSNAVVNANGETVPVTDTSVCGALRCALSTFATDFAMETRIGPSFTTEYPGTSFAMGVPAKGCTSTLGMSNTAVISSSFRSGPETANVASSVPSKFKDLASSDFKISATNGFSADSVNWILPLAV